MKAVHPNTGKPISIIKTETQVTKTNRTLLWHTHTLVDSPRWNRWSVIVTDPKSLISQPKPEIAFIYTLANEEERLLWSKWLETATNETLIVITPKLMTQFRLNAEYIESLLSTSEFELRYPFLSVLTDTAPIDRWIANIAALMRFHKIVSPFEMPESTFKNIQKIDPTEKAENVVPAIYLIQQYFKSPNAKRQQEINYVLDQNIKCSYIDKIILLNEQSYALPKSDKIEQVIINKRLTYLDVMRYIKNSVPKDTYVVFSNSDIYMDETLCALYSLHMEKKFISLLRYDVVPGQEAKIYGPRPDSQDTWIVSASSIDFEPTEQDFDFTFGIPGCDNAINVSMLRNKFIVINPSLTMRSYHVHNSNVRTYVKSDVVDKPVFLYLTPTAIQEYNPITALTKYKVKSWTRKPLQSFTRQIKYVDKVTADTICNMMRRSSDYEYDVESANTFNQGLQEHDDILYKFTDAFTMPSGLVADYSNLYVGKHSAWTTEWTKASLTVLTNTVEVPNLCAPFFPPELSKSAALWALHYLPKVLAIKQHTTENLEFVIPNHTDTQRFLQLLKWAKHEEIKMVPYMEDSQYYSKNVYSLSPLSTKEVTAESITLLRTKLPEKKENENPVVVIVVERNSSSIFTTAWAHELIKNVFTRGQWETHVVDADSQTEKRLNLLMQADLLIAPANSEWEALEWSWLLKPGSSVIELMEDTSPRGDHIHLAGAALLNYILVGVKREPVPYQRQHAIEDIKKSCEQHVFQETYKAQVPRNSIPTIILPAGKALTGFHEHAGDTFREMVKIWGQRNYCKVEYRDDTPYVWWDEIGEILLYDRPTLRWFQSSPPSYKLALYGNAFQENPTKRDRKWSFWGRSPAAIEKAAIMNTKTFNSRKFKSVFLGRIENGVQKAHRTTQNWSSVIELFSMPIDSTGGPYKYTQEEYLTHLSNSKFGLCLPGFGPKCNREIEYLAMGTVPIITPGVDFTNYQVPPIKDVHYFVAKTPEDVKTIVETTSPEKWTMMSIAGRGWWQRYASAEGLFRLTWGIINDAVLHSP